MRRELKEVKDRMEEARGEWDRLREDREQNHIDLTDDDGESDEKEDLQEDEIDDDGTRTIRLDETEAAELFHEKSQNVPLSLHTSSNKGDTQEKDSRPHEETSKIAATQARLEQENTALSQRMEALSGELSAAAQLSSSLKSQYSEAAETIRGLEVKVNSLEKALHSQRSSVEAHEAASQDTGRRSIEDEVEQGSDRDDILREVESRFTNWKRSFEEAVQKERQGWEKEREELRITLSEWEKRSESLKQSQNISSTSNGSRRKRRSKASTVGTSSEESSDSQNDSLEEGFISPVTEEEAHSSPRDGDELRNTEGIAYPKRPRSRRRNYRSGEAAKAAKRAAAKAEANGASDGNMSSNQATGGSSVRRRQSWIPFSQSSHGPTQAGEPVEAANGTKKQQQRGREAAGVMDVSLALPRNDLTHLLTGTCPSFVLSASCSANRFSSGSTRYRIFSLHSYFTASEVGRLGYQALSQIL